MSRFVPADRDTAYLLPPSVDEWLPAALGVVQTLIADNGFFSQANMSACRAAEIEPLLALKRESHHLPVQERFAAESPPPQTGEPVFGIIKRVMGWRQMSMRRLAKAQGEWSLVTMAWNIKRLYVPLAAKR